MKEKDYKRTFKMFIQEIKETKCPAFINFSTWTLLKDLQNGVQIDSVMETQSDRELLHQIGLKYGLIPLCPNEVVDVDLSEDGIPVRSVVRTSFGKMTIKENIRFRNSGSKFRRHET
nr:hypothetical protein [uncultured Desulfobacter sp.]